MTDMPAPTRQHFGDAAFSVDRARHGTVGGDQNEAGSAWLDADVASVIAELGDAVAWQFRCAMHSGVARRSRTVVAVHGNLRGRASV